MDGLLRKQWCRHIKPVFTNVPDRMLMRFVNIKAMKFIYLLMLLVDLKFSWKLMSCPSIDQNSFGRSKMVLVKPNLFGLDHNDLDTTKMNWSGPNWTYDVSFWLKKPVWTWPNHFGCDQIIMVRSKSIWSDQNHFGPTKTVLVT